MTIRLLLLLVVLLVGAGASRAPAPPEALQGASGAGSRLLLVLDMASIGETPGPPAPISWTRAFASKSLHFSEPLSRRNSAGAAAAEAPPSWRTPPE